MRVLILSQYYAPEPIPKPVELARELSRRGHEITVLTGFPNYPTGRLYPGYRLAPMRREILDGIPIIRTFEFPYHGRHAAGRILNYGTFMLSAVLGACAAPRCDVVYVWHPPLSIGVAAWIVSCLGRIPFVYDVQDIWPESVVLSGVLHDGHFARALSRLERFVYARARRILVVTDGARDNLIAKGVPPEKVRVMSHWVDETLFAATDSGIRERIRSEYGWGDRFVVLFAGNLGLVQGLDTVLEAAQGLGPNSSTLIVLMGDGTERERLQTRAQGLGVTSRVQFVPRQPAARMPDFMAASDVLLVHLQGSPLCEYVIPTKTFSYLAAGRPILLAMDGPAARLVRDAGAGLIVPPESPQLMTAAIREFEAMTNQARETMGELGRTYLARHFAKQKVIPEYEALLEEAARGLRG